MITSSPNTAGSSRLASLLSLVVLLALLVSGCAGAPAAPAAIQPAVAAAAAPAPTVSYKLVTNTTDGKMAFVGVGGEISGQSNPTLTADVGDVIEIVLTNGDSVQHNVAIEPLNVKSEYVNRLGAETRLVFQVNEAGELTYLCDLPGHRQAGMLGKIVVGGGAGAAMPAGAPTGAPMAHTGAAPTAGAAAPAADLPLVSRPAADLPGPLNRTTPTTVQVNLETVEVNGGLAPGATYTFWTFNGQVPGPFIRVMAGDTVQVNFKNAANSMMAHSVDFHAVTGPGGGAVSTQTSPGGESSFSFKALNPGLYVYHCATPSVAQHITNGMFGMILVEPEGGLPPVDREFYVMQSELYTAEPFGQGGALTFDYTKMLNEAPEYFLLNGGVGSLTGERAMHANVGETVRIFYGVGGPNFISSFHVIGEIFDRVYNLGSLTSTPLTDVQSVLVPTGGTVVVEFTLQVPGRYLLVDHSLSRLERGLVGHLEVAGEPNPDVYDGPTSSAGGH